MVGRLAEVVSVVAVNAVSISFITGLNPKLAQQFARTAGALLYVVSY